MADEVEEYLVKKLQNALALPEMKSTSKKLLAWPAGIRKRIDKLEDLLKPGTPESMASKVQKPEKRKELLYNLNNILTEYQMRSNHFTLKSNLDKIFGDVQSVQPQAPGDQPPTTDGYSRGAASQPSTGQEISARVSEPYRWSYRFVNKDEVHGFTDKVRILKRQLVPQNANDSRFRAIGIVGMRGVGKTTLSQVIFNNEEVKSHFLPRIWVCVSKQPDEKESREEMVRRMLRRLGVEEEVIDSAYKTHKLKGLLFALRLQLVGKKYLIILDDLWNTEDSLKNFCSGISEEAKCEEKLAYGLPKGCGGAVIVTSRTMGVVKEMVGEENLHRLEPLQDKASIWSIFEGAAKKEVQELSPDLVSLKERIVDKCAGLPLAAKMMGQIANQQIRQEASAPVQQPAPVNPSQIEPVPEEPPATQISEGGGGDEEQNRRS